MMSRMFWCKIASSDVVTACCTCRSGMAHGPVAPGSRPERSARPRGKATQEMRPEASWWVKIKPGIGAVKSSMFPFARASHFGVTLFLVSQLARKFMADPAIVAFLKVGSNGIETSTIGVCLSLIPVRRFAQMKPLDCHCLSSSPSSLLSIDLGIELVSVQASSSQRTHSASRVALLRPATTQREPERGVGSVEYSERYQVRAHHRNARPSRFVGNDCHTFGKFS